MVEARNIPRGQIQRIVITILGCPIAILKINKTFFAQFFHDGCDEYEKRQIKILNIYKF